MSELSDEEVILQRAIKQWARDTVLPAGYYQLEQTGEFPGKPLAELAKMGYLGMSFPEEYGGIKATTAETSIVAAELAYGWPSLHLIWSANLSLAGYPIMHYGDSCQKELYLRDLAEGRIFGAYALTEPDAGSDAANIRLRAGYKGRGLWVLNGSKTYITNALHAGVMVVFARVSREDAERYAKDLPDNHWKKRHAGITAFVLRNPRVSVRNIPKWGFVSSTFSEVVFDNVKTRYEDILGKVGGGFHIAMDTLNNGRINIAAQSAGIARRALDEAEQYGSARYAFGMPIIQMEVHKRKLKRLRKRAEYAWLLTLDAARAKDNGDDVRVAAAKAKLSASEAAVECAMFNYRLQGGFGYTKESIAMMILHDALATVTYEGTSDIQRLTIDKASR